MRSLLRLAGFLALALLIAETAGPASAQTGLDFTGDPNVYIDINQGVGRKYNIAIPDLLPPKPGGGVDENAAYLPNRLAANLTMTGFFNSLDRRSFLEMGDATRAGLDEGSAPDFTPWAKIGADFLIKGTVNVSGSKLTLEMRLFDVGLGRPMLGKRYTGTVKEGRRMINQFTNAVLEAITGTPGVFGSQIIFASGTPSSKDIMMTELGGDDAVLLAGHKGGPSTQPTLGPGGRTAWVHRNDKKWELLVDGKVISGGDLHLSPAFRPDGSVAAAVSNSNSTDIYLFNGRQKTLLINSGGISVSPTFSPDGSRMAYVSNQGGATSIFVAPASGGAGTPLTSGAKATDPAWSPTGEFITFVTRETDICIVRPDGTGLRQLTGGQGVNHRPSFSPDGRMIVFSSTRNGRRQLFIMAANGDSQQPLMPDYKSDQEQPYWSPTMPAEK
jgi:TolB protein